MSEVNELEQLRVLRDTVPWPAPERLADCRARLLAAAQDAHRQARWRPDSAPRPGVSRRAVALAGAAAVTVAAGVVGYAVSTRTAPPAPHATSGHAHAGPASAQAILAAKVLRTAAAHVALQGATTEPSPGQWIYSKTVTYEVPPGNGSPVDQNWITFDGAHSAYYQDGQLIVHASPIPLPRPGTSAWAAWNSVITPKTAYDVLASLPTRPQSLLAVIARQIAGRSPDQITQGTPLAGPGPWTQAQLEFDYLAGILWNAAGGVGGPPAAEAAVYQALATLPGISVRHGITDAAGNPSIAVSADGGYNELLIDPASYQVIGLRQLSKGAAAAAVPAPPSVTALRALLTSPHLPAHPMLPRPYLTQLRRQFAGTPRAEQEAFLAQLLEKWAKKYKASLPQNVPPKGAVVESIALAQVTEVARPGQR